MSLVERFVQKKIDDLFGEFHFGVTASGELGQIIEEAEADFLTKWLEKIENRNGKTRPLTEKERERILERDNYTCLVPHCNTPHFKLQVHHLVWREFGGSNNPENLATLCLYHHLDMHPGLRETFDAYRRGDKTAFKKYLEENQKWKYQPVPRIADIIAGIVWEKTRRINGGK